MERSSTSSFSEDTELEDEVQTHPKLENVWPKYWSFFKPEEEKDKYANPDCGLYKVNTEEEYFSALKTAKALRNQYKIELFRVQNFFMYICYYALKEYYRTHGYIYKEYSVLVVPEKSSDAEKYAKILDPSDLLIYIMRTKRIHLKNDKNQKLFNYGKQNSSTVSRKIDSSSAPVFNYELWKQTPKCDKLLICSILLPEAKKSNKTKDEKHVLLPFVWPKYIVHLKSNRKASYE